MCQNYFKKCKAPVDARNLFSETINSERKNIFLNKQDMLGI